MSIPLIRKSVQTLHAYTPGEQPRVPDLIKLNTNENPFPPSPRVTEALRRMELSTLRLYPDPMCTEIRQQLAALYDVDTEQIFVGNGSDEILRLCMRAFTETGGTVAAFDPTYSLYPVLAAAEELKYVPVPLADDFTWMNPGAAVNEATLFLLANPNAPTGIQYPFETIQTFCETFNGVVLLDEAYADFAQHNGLALAKSLPNVLICRTLSKSWSLAGLRVGFAMGPKVLIDALYKLKDSYNLDALAQRVALAALQDADYMQANVKTIVRLRDATKAELKKMGFHVAPSSTNFLWMAPPAPHTAAHIFDALRAKHILVRYFPGSRTGNHLRITIGTEEQMQKLLSVLAEELATH